MNPSVLAGVFGGNISEKDGPASVRASRARAYTFDVETVLLHVIGDVVATLPALPQVDLSVSTRREPIDVTAHGDHLLDPGPGPLLDPRSWP